MRSNTIVAWSSVSASLASNRAIVQGREPAPVVVASAFRSFCLLYAAFRLNALLWNGGQHGCRILVPNLGRHHCLWHLDCRWHDRCWLAFGLDAHGTTYRHCGFDQPLSSNSRCQNRVAVRRLRFFLTSVRFGAHCGLNSDIAPSPKSAKLGSCCAHSITSSAIASKP